jgi:hypothetical protein
MMILVAILGLAGQDGPPIRLDCIADTMLSLHEGEERLSHGKRGNLRLKGIENLALLDFDLAPLKGRRIEEARLFLHPREIPGLKTLGLSTIGTPWKEGDNHGQAAKAGEPTFLEAAHGERPWAHPGSDFHAVSFSRGGSIWFRRDLRREADGWISVELPPALLHAMLEGNSFGFAVADAKEQTGANNSVDSREQSGKKAPYVLVTRSAPGTPPPSGARRTAPRVPPVVTDRTKSFLVEAPPPAGSAPLSLPDGCRWHVLHETEVRPDAPPAGDLWDGRSVRLSAARGEHVGFQVVLRIPEGESRRIAIGGEGWVARRAVPVGGRLDPLVPVEGELKGVQVFHLERHVPTSRTPGKLEAPLTLETGRARLSLPVSLQVHQARLPDDLGFAISLNAYHFPQPERDYFRMAHEHRATLAVVPYSHRGHLREHVAPKIRRQGATVTVESWEAYDARWGPYLDGSAFRGLPREGVPLDHMYWPMHEQWPLPINEFYGYRGRPEDHWRDAPDPEEAFPPEYGRAFEGIIRDFARHAEEKGWTRTRAHVFLNNKPNIRLERKEPEGAWWRLDEPVSVDDHLAIRYFGLRSRDAAKAFPKVPILFRADLSRPQYRRELLDGLIGLDVVAGSYRRYPELVFGLGEDVWVYGGLPAPGANGQWGRAWALQAFLDGADGIVPWLALGTPKAWEVPEDTALLLPGKDGPAATLRLKGLRRGQQDVELLRLLIAKRGWKRGELREGLFAALGLASGFKKVSEEDAGRVDFSDLDPARFEQVRRSVLQALDAR